ncbi:MAG: hypothetical protein H7Y11_11325, partial [Armatimonadetes bacterium]|nr:hypothetical protein [Anaerolineae bacterium]
KNAAGDYRFNVIDPGGNYVRFIQQVTPTEQPTSADRASAATKLARAVRAADVLVNAKGDFPAAAKLLDTALAHAEPAVTAIERVQAWVLRAEVAVNMDDQVLAKQLLTAVRDSTLTAEERFVLTEAFHTVEDLSDLLEQP